MSKRNNIETFKILSNEEEKKLTKEELIQYYIELKEYYKQKSSRIKNSFNKLVHNLYRNLTKYLRKYSLEILNEDNIPTDTPVIFVCNHSNTHDFYTVQEIFKDMVNVLASEECLNPISKFLFAISGSNLIDRRDKESRNKGFYQNLENLSIGNNIVFFSEGTWNLHPSKITLPLSIGAIKTAQISGVPIVPVIFEYIEKDEICTKEGELYEKCIINFGKPIYVNITDNIYEKLEILKENLSTIRWNLWSKNKVYERKEINFDIYENHELLKTNTTLFKYQYDLEEKAIYNHNNYIYENYPINSTLHHKQRKKLK